MTASRVSAPKRQSSDFVVGQDADAVILRGDYSPRSVLTAELAPKKNKKERITLEVSEKFITVWTRESNLKELEDFETHVHIFRRTDRSIWYGFGKAEKVKVDGRTYPASDSQYSEITESMVGALGNLFYSYPENVSILNSIDEITGKQPDSLNRFLKLLMKFVA